MSMYDDDHKTIDPISQALNNDQLDNPFGYFGNQDKVGEIKKLFKPELDIYKRLSALKAINIEYRDIVEDVITLFLMSEHFNGTIPEDYSTEYMLGLREGLSIFCYPDKLQRRLEECVRREIKECGGYDGE